MTEKNKETKEPQIPKVSPIVEPQTVKVELSEFQTTLLAEYRAIMHTLKTGKKRARAIRKLLIGEGIPDSVIGE